MTAASVPAPEATLSALLDARGLGLDIRRLDHPPSETPSPPGLVRVGIRRGAGSPRADLEGFDILLCDDPLAPPPWVGLAPEVLDETIATLRQAVERQPLASAVAAQVLRMTLAVTFDQALLLESLAYSTLLASAPFRAWRAATPVRARTDLHQRRVRLDEAADGLGGAALEITLTRPGARNAVDARMRDALVEALDFAAADPLQRAVVLRGEGPAFSAGGDLDEFGQAADPGLAHAIRTLQSPIALLHGIRRRVTARLHGACIGAGVELPAAAGQVIAAPDAFFRLPEVSMGLIPGAGGTASIPRRIGRQRTCFMALTGRDIDAATALAWGLVDALEPGAAE